MRRANRRILIPRQPGAASKREAQSQHSFALSFFIQVSDSGEQQIVERNHSGQLPVIAVDYRKPCETRLGHPEHGGAQRLIRMSHDGFSQHIRQRHLRCRRFRQFAQLLAGDHGLHALLPVHHGIEMLPALRRLAYQDVPQILDRASAGSATTFVRITSRTNRISSGSVAYSRVR